MKDFLDYILRDHPILFIIAIASLVIMLPTALKKIKLMWLTDYFFEEFFEQPDENKRIKIIRLYSAVKAGWVYLNYLCVVYILIFFLLFGITEKNKFLTQKQVDLGSSIEVISYLVSAVIGFLISIFLKSPGQKYRDKVGETLIELQRYVQENMFLEKKLLGQIINTVKWTRYSIKTADSHADVLRNVANEFYTVFRAPHFFELGLTGYCKNGTVHLNWKKVPKKVEVRYKINRTPNFADGQTKSVPTPPYHYIDSELAPNTEYRYWLTLEYNENIEERPNEGVFIKTPQPLE